MKEHPILFSAPMVRALLAGTKTQTRRAIKPQPSHFLGGPGTTDDQGRPTESTPMRDGNGMSVEIRCPYGAPGDRLWVRETWMDLQGTGVEVRTGDRSRYAYGADTPAGSYGDEQRKLYGLKWRPSIHMPRAVSRITLDVVGVRVQRLQDISEADAQAEGIAYSEPFRGYCIGQAEHFNSHDPRQSYFSLWETINGEGSVEANPWVWVVEFKRVEA